MIPPSLSPSYAYSIDDLSPEMLSHILSYVDGTLPEETEGTSSTEKESSSEEKKRNFIKKNTTPEQRRDIFNARLVHPIWSELAKDLPIIKRLELKEFLKKQALLTNNYFKQHCYLFFHNLCMQAGIYLEECMKKKQWEWKYYSIHIGLVLLTPWIAIAQLVEDLSIASFVNLKSWKTVSALEKDYLQKRIKISLSYVCETWPIITPFGLIGLPFLISDIKSEKEKHIKLLSLGIDPIVELRNEENYPKPINIDERTKIVNECFHYFSYVCKNGILRNEKEETFLYDIEKRPWRLLYKENDKWHTNNFKVNSNFRAKQINLKLIPATIDLNEELEANQFIPLTHEEEIFLGDLYLYWIATKIKA